MTKPDTLADYVRRLMRDKNLDAAEISRRSRYGGRKGVSRAYVNQIKNGEAVNPSKDKLSILAGVFKIPVEEMLRMALLKPPPANKNRLDQLTLDYSRLTPELQTRLEPVIAMVEREVRFYLLPD